MPYRVLTCLIVALFPATVVADGPDVGDFDPLFANTDTLTVEVEGPFSRITRERSDEEELPGKFRYTAADGSLVEFDVLFRARGNWRRNPDVCRFPPIRINFKKSQTDETLFDKQDKLKLVTHCQNNSKNYEQAVISEYLVYRMLNLLTDYSFRARLLKLTYVYTDDNVERETYGVLIEHNDRISKRIDGQPMETEKVAVDTIKPDHLNLTSVFHYLVGNTDFSPRASPPDKLCCHNQTLFAHEDSLYSTIPYDFDQTGLVNAEHAAPNPRFRIRTVRVRVYRGRCVNNDLLPQTLEKFRDKRTAIEALIANQPELRDKTRKSMLKYIESFYGTIENPKHVESRMVKRCI